MRLRLFMIVLVVMSLGSKVFQDVQAAPQATTSARASQGAARIREQEPNDTTLMANTVLGQTTSIRGNVVPGTDRDVYAISLTAGQRLSAATMTAASTSNDTVLTMFLPDGTTVLETDDNDGAISTTASVINSVPVPTTGTYFVEVKGKTTTAQIRYYDLYIRIGDSQSTPEIEFNGSIAYAQALAPSGIMTGIISEAHELDIYRLPLNAGDTIFASLDLDPERDGVAWNGYLGIGIATNTPIYVDDTTATSPNSEAHFMTVQETGTYYVYVSNSPGRTVPANASYRLTVSVLPAMQDLACQTYTATPQQAFGPGTEMLTSSIVVPDDVVIADVDVLLNLSHSDPQEVDVHLQAPGGNVVGLLSDVGTSMHQPMQVTLDDEAAVPIHTIQQLKGMHVLPEPNYRLHWLYGTRSGGTWTLTLYDDTDNAKGGTLQSWGLRICSTPPITCPDGASLITVFDTNFELNSAGFTHAGTNDSWAYGNPNAAPIVGSASGTKSWKTNLTGNYLPNSGAVLMSPPITIPVGVGQVYAQWSHHYQMESASSDQYAVTIGTGTVTQTLYEFLDNTMADTSTFGSPAAPLNQSTGWSQQRVRLNTFNQQSIRFAFSLTSNASMEYAGVAVDDVKVFGCTTQITPTATATAGSPTATATSGSPTVTVTPVTPSATATPGSPTTVTPTATPIMPTATATTPTATATPITPTATATTPTATATTPTATATPIMPTATATTPTGTTVIPRHTMYVPALIK